MSSFYLKENTGSGKNQEPRVKELVSDRTENKNQVSLLSFWYFQSSISEFPGKQIYNLNYKFQIIKKKMNKRDWRNKKKFKNILNRIFKKIIAVTFSKVINTLVGIFFQNSLYSFQNPH